MDRLLRSARQSGSLNLSNRSLREVPSEVYRSLDAVEQDEKWWESVELQKLILAHNSIEILKEDLRNVSLLTVLNVSHNKLSCLPGAIGELPMLKSLDVSYNLITTIPEEIGSTSSLAKFDCSNNLLEVLPHSLGQCLGLCELKVSNNNLRSLPDDLVGCSKLMKLDLEGNKMTELSEDLFLSWTMLSDLNAAKNMLTSIPESIGYLSALVRLEFHQNKISSVPSSIMGCSSLAEFYIGMNLLSSIPVEIGELAHLGTLDLHSNQLKEFPVQACKLRLSVLDLSNNSLCDLPAELGNMTSLRKLLLNGNPLRTLRSSLVSGPTSTLLKYLRTRLSPNEEVSSSDTVSKMENQIAMAARISSSSKELSISGLGLLSVPSAAWENNEIVKIDLSKNLIDSLPEELSLCSLLQNMVLSGNKIKDWPGTVLGSFCNLTCLKLDCNRLSKIPSNGFQGILNLRILDLSGNAASYPDPPGFSFLPHLQELYLRRMQLHEVPLDLLNMQQLLILDLSQNSISTIPKEFKNMLSLRELHLSDNNITSLPAELGLLENRLHVLKIDGNPLRSIRRVILDRGTNAILKYLKDKFPEQ